MAIDHTELFELVGKMTEEHDIHHLRWCIQECHNGRLHRPITPENLHLFRRYRNDPENGSGDAKRLITDALDYALDNPSSDDEEAAMGVSADAWDGGFAKNH